MHARSLRLVAVDAPGRWVESIVPLKNGRPGGSEAILAARVTIHDVARMAGVSVATVSRVINSRADVKEPTRRRVEEAVESLQFRPLGLARNSASRKTGTIAVVLNQLDWPIIADSLGALHHTITGYGYNTIMAASEGGISARRHCLQLLVDRRVDGAIFFAPQGELYSSVLEKLGVAEQPDRGLYCLALERPRGFQVLIDEEQLGRLAAGHLISSGAEHLAAIVGPSQLGTSQKRLRSFLDGVASLGRSAGDVVIEQGANWNYDAGYAAMEAILARADAAGVRIDGVFAQSDYSAIGALKLLNQRGIRVPEDVLVIGVDNMAIGAFSVPSLTTIDIRVRDRAEIAARELIHLIEAPDLEPLSATVPVSLVVRGSSRRSITLPG